jgi:hypothetical protein
VAYHLIRTGQYSLTGFAKVVKTRIVAERAPILAILVSRIRRGFDKLIPYLLIPAIGCLPLAYFGSWYLLLFLSQMQTWYGLPLIISGLILLSTVLGGAERPGAIGSPPRLGWKESKPDYQDD